MPKVYLLATFVALMTAGLFLSGCPKPTTVVEPVPQFEAAPQRGVVPLKVRFEDTSLPGKSRIRAWNWEFGDGAVATTPSPVHEYKSPGVYSVKLTVTTGEGAFSVVKENLVTVLHAGDYVTPDPDTNTVGAEGVLITIPPALQGKVAFGISKTAQQIAPNAYEQIILMSETYTITHGLRPPELYVYDELDRPVPTKISMPLLDKLPVPVTDVSALFLLAYLPDGRTVPIPGKVTDNRFVAPVLRMPPTAQYAVAMRPETVSDDTRSLERLYQARLDADDNWADYWKIILTRSTAEEIAALYYGDIEDETTFHRRNFSDDELTDAAAVAAAVAHAVHNLLADADMRVPTLIMETDTDGGTYHNLVMYNMQPRYTYDFEKVSDLLYYDYYFGHIVVDPAQLLAISVRNARLAAADLQDVDIRQRLSSASAITEALTKSTYAGYQIPQITTRGGGPLNLPIPADEMPDGKVMPIDFMQGLLDGAPVYFAQRVEDFLLNNKDVAAEDLNFDVDPEAFRKLARGFGDNEYALLSAPLFFPYSPYVPGYSISGQEFFCYLHNDKDFDEPMGLLVAIIEAIAQEIDDYLAEALYPVDFAQALVGLYTVMDDGIIEIMQDVAAPESENLRDFYWKYLKDRAYVNSGEALLRPTDVLRPPFTFNEDRFEESAVVHVHVDGATDAFTLSHEDHPALESVMPLSSRVLVFELNSLTNELELQFNTADWKIDDDGYGPAIAVYKEGSAGIELADPADVYRDYALYDTTGDGVNDTVTVRRLQLRTQESETCTNRVIVLIGNLNYSDVSDISVSVKAYSDMVVAENSALHRYVYACDPLYDYSLTATYNLYEEDVAAHVLSMTSGAWRSANDVYETVWHHELAIIEPNNVRENTAMLVVSGGSIGSGVSSTEIAILAELARASQTVVALLAGVPNQPLNFAGERRTRSEDAIIAYSYDKYIDSVEAGAAELTWPVLLPMTRAAVRAMDTVQDFMASKPGRVRDIDNFVVAGASKRGWTTWLTAVAETMESQLTGTDPRVSAIIPMVIDVLNMPAQLEHHFKAYQGYPINDPLNGIVGGYSRALRDYVEFEIFDRFDTEGGQSLLQIVDPFTYRSILTMPKLIANSTGDQFFLPDSSKFYFDQMLGQNYLHYAANTDHSLSSGIMVDFDTLESILAFYRAHVKNMSRFTDAPAAMPTYTWEEMSNRTQVVDGQTVVYARTKVTANPLPREGMLKVWSAYTPQHRDFRLESSQPPFWTYQWVPYDPITEGWIIEVPIPLEGWRGFYAQLRFEGSAPGADYLFTTPVRVVPENKYPLPHQDRN